MAAYVKFSRETVEALAEAEVRFRAPRCGCGSTDLWQHEDRGAVLVHCGGCGRDHQRRVPLVVTIPLIPRARALALEIQKIAKAETSVLPDGSIEVREGGLLGGALIERPAGGAWFRSDGVRPEPVPFSPPWEKEVEGLIEAFGPLTGRMVPVLPSTVEVLAVDVEFTEGPLSRNSYRLPVAPNGRPLRPVTGRLADVAGVRLYEATRAALVVGAADGRVGFQRVVGRVDPRTRVPVAEPVRSPWTGRLERVPTALKRAAEAAVLAAKAIAAGDRIPAGGAWLLLPAAAALPATETEETSDEAVVLVQPTLDEAVASPVSVSEGVSLKEASSTEASLAETEALATATPAARRPVRKNGKKARKAAAALRAAKSEDDDWDVKF